MIGFRARLWVIASAATLACGAPGGAVRVTDSSVRYDFPQQGISVLPPVGARWWAVPGKTFGPDHVIVFGKPVGDHVPQQAVEVRSIVAGLLAYPCSEFELSDDVASADDMKRHLDERLTDAALRAWAADHARRLVATQEVVDRSPGAECVRYDETIEDTRVPRFEGSTFVERQRGFRCLHPFQRGVVVEFGWSERHLAGEPSAGLDAEVQPFMDSIRFAPPRH